MLKEYSRTKNSILNLLTGFVGQSMTVLLNFCVRTVFIKSLGPSYLGIDGLFTNILSLLSLAELGFDTAISYRLYKPIAEGDDAKVRHYLIFFRNIYLVVGTVVFILGLLFIPFLSIFIKDYDKLGDLGINATFIFLLYLINSVSSYLFFAYRSIIVRAKQKQYILEIIGLLTIFLSSIAKIVYLLNNNNFVGYVIIAIVFCILHNLVNAIVAKKYYPNYFKKEDKRLSNGEVRDVFKDCMALLVYKVNNAVMQSTDNLVLSSFIGLVTVGLYSNYLLVSMAIRQLLRKIFDSIKASMGDLFVSDDVQKKYFYFEITNFVTIVLYGTSAIVFAVEINEFITNWIGDEYIIPQPLPILMGVELLLTGMKLNLAQIREVSGVFRQMWFRPIWGSCLNIFFSILLVQYVEVSGVILGTIIAALFANLAIDPYVIHKYSFNKCKTVGSYYKKQMLYALVVIFIGVIVYYVSTNFITGMGWLSLAIHIILAALMSMSFIFLFFWRKRECIYIRNKIEIVFVKGK